MITLERFHIYKSRRIDGNILNNTYAESENPIFKIIYDHENN
jgi:hypothetical protein